VSLLGTYFAANPEQAGAVFRGESVQGVVLLDGPGLMPTDLGELERRITDNESWEVVAEAEEQWLIRLGDGFAATIAGLPEPLGDDLADQWQLSSYEIDFLDVLRPVAVRAVAAGVSMYALISL
jgi:hypothetical protein